MFVVVFFFFKQKTAYELRISDWSSDVCSSDLVDVALARDVEAVTVFAVPSFGVALQRQAAQRADDVSHAPAQARSLASASRLSAKASATRMRSEERRVGKECVRTCRTGW